MPASSSPGHTTILAAVGRGIHNKDGGARLLADPYALDLAGDAGAALLAGLRQQVAPEALITLGQTFALRARVVEDEVARAAADGATQYVILGAGLDSFALRRTGATLGLRVFEVDRPEAQAWKRKRLAELGIAEPVGVAYVPVDFETGGLHQALTAHGFEFTDPAVMSWIAVTQYLQPPAVNRTLEVIRSVPKGSRLVMTYVVPPADLTELEQRGLAWIMTQAKERGEPFHTLLKPGEADELLQRHGFESAVHIGPAELRDRYFENDPDVALPGIERIVVASL